MGCHTWFKIPIAVGKEEVISYAKGKVDSYRTEDWWNEGCETEYQTFLALCIN